MTSRYTLRYLPAALDDLISIFDWIADKNPRNAAAFVDKIDQQISVLKTHPFLGRIPRDEKIMNAGYRVLIVESYLVFYMVNDKTVVIHRVIHGSRNLEDII